MKPRDDTQLALRLGRSELALSDGRKAQLVSALAELILIVARERCLAVKSKEDGDDREADT